MTIKTASESSFNTVDWIPTGLLALDKILGGGVPTKRITEVSGPNSIGKTTLALMLAGQAQKMGKKVIWADQEWSWDNAYAEILGVDTKKVGLIQEEIAEMALDDIEDFAAKEKGALIVIDSVGALNARKEAEKDMGGKTIAVQANLVSKFCRKIVPRLAIYNHALLVINHEFMDIMSPVPKIKTSGGAKLEYHKSIWLRLKKTNKRVLEGERQTGDIIEAEIRKHKLAPTMKQTCELTMIYGAGFSVEADLMQQLLDSGEITKKGNTFFYGDKKLGVGLRKARETLTAKSPTI